MRSSGSIILEARGSQLRDKVSEGFTSPVADETPHLPTPSEGYEGGEALYVEPSRGWVLIDGVRTIVPEGAPGMR